MSVIVAALLAAFGPVEGRELASARYGLTLTLPEGWTIAERERDDKVVVAMLPAGVPGRPGVFACEIGLAPESLDEWRTRVDETARRRRWTLVRNEVVEVEGGRRLETFWEFRPSPEIAWVERTVRVIANRQIYTFLIQIDTEGYARERGAFEAAIESARFAEPETGCEPVEGPANRWAQREYRFAIDLPEGWRPALAPAEIALLYANGPARGIWSDNVLVIARPKREEDLAELARTLPAQLVLEEPGCEVLKCEVVDQGKAKALETVVRTRRGPFSMTVLERRFTGDRFDYEAKFTVESERFEGLEAEMRRCLDGFEELPGTVPGAGRPA
jgi:hypothetical protein